MGYALDRRWEVCVDQTLCEEQAVETAGSIGKDIHTEGTHPLGGGSGPASPVWPELLPDLHEEDEEVPEEVHYRKRLEKTKMIRSHPIIRRVKPPSQESVCA